MKNFFSTLLVVFSTSTALMMSACSDKKDDATPQTGTVTGQITPAASITTVTATSASNQTSTATPTAAGAYTISNLAAGTYTLSYTPAAGYAAPATQSVTVTAGGTTTATPVTVTTSGGSGGTIRYSVGGAVITPSIVAAQLVSGSLLITGAGATGSVTLSLGAFANAPGTFTLGATSTSLIDHTEVVGMTLLTWSTFRAGGSGTITVTSVGANPRRVSGTFSAVAPPSGSNTAATRTLTNGTFTDVTY